MAMEEMMVRVDKFDLTCRTCLCNCENGLSFNVHNFQLFDNTAVADVLSKCALIHVRYLTAFSCLIITPYNDSNDVISFR